MIESVFLGEYLTVTINRPLGSFHPIYNFQYPVNYGYISGTLANDNEEVDAYVLGVTEPLSLCWGRYLLYCCK